MHYQMVLLGKTLTALVTNIWPLPGMEFAVCHQVAFQWERPATFLANEWPLAAISNGTREEEKNGQKFQNIQHPNQFDVCDSDSCVAAKTECSNEYTYINVNVKLPMDP